MPRLTEIRLSIEGAKRRDDPSGTGGFGRLGIDWNSIEMVLTFGALFSEDEKRLNLGYTFWGYLFEVDGNMDKYVIWPNGSGLLVQRAPQGDPDEYIGFFGSERARPEGKSERDFELRLQFDWESKPELAQRVAEDGAESFDSIVQEFRAIAVAVPDAGSFAAGFSNQVSESLSAIARAFTE